MARGLLAEPARRDPSITGDYQGLASAGTAFLPFFSQTHGTDPGSIFCRRVGA